MFSAGSSYIAVVAIDFGTTYNGFAFAFNQRKGEGGIHVNKAWGYDQGTATLKNQPLFYFALMRNLINLDTKQRKSTPTFSMMKIGNIFTSNISR